MVSEAYQGSVRVNGALLPTYTGQEVILAGTVTQVDPSGSSLMVKASDGKVVKVTLPNPLQDSVEGVVEVHGVGQGQQVLGQTLVTFPEMPATEFDATQYNEAIKLMQSVKDSPWKAN